jgi:rod shape determining protein RodA
MFRRWVLPMCITILALFSLVTLRSIAPSLLSKQTTYFAVGAIIFYVTSRISFWNWLKLSPFLYGFLIFLLLLTHLIGNVTRGTTSWIPIGSFHVQPSQLAVAFVGLFLCGWINNKPINSFSRLIQYTLIIGFPAFLIFIEPELGTTIVYMAALGSVFLLSKTKPLYIIVSFVSVLLLSVLTWNLLLHDYQKNRIFSYMNSSQQTKGASYNAQQSMIAVGSGELYGRGIGQGVQSHLRFLPERQTDFIFASFSEEMGFLGAFPVIFLYSAVVFFIIFAGANAKTEAEQFFCYITATMLAVQSSINIGMNIGLLPITGITLPFFSYGGSSVLAWCFQLGCIQAILQHYRKRETLHIR